MPLLDGLRRELGAEGLHIVVPLIAATADEMAGMRLQDLLAGARSGVVIGDGGRDFFDRFWAHGDRHGADPLDHYTARVVTAASERAFVGTGEAYTIAFPFARAQRPLPFQRLGQAAGVPPPGPLGLQIHPVYGPWWAYRALIVTTAPLVGGAPVGDCCDGCEAPCISACPAGAPGRSGFALARCLGRRTSVDACRLSCDARIRCVGGPEHRYSVEQLAFHMVASLPRSG
jgi:epoxyqueuosine reductase QueG